MNVKRDSPASSTKDRFGRTIFVRRLSQQLYDSNSQRSTGLVIGLTGPWGGGKSQVLLYVKERLERRAALLRQIHKKNAKPIIVVQFNPWLYTGRENLLGEFFRTVESSAETNTKYYPQLKEITNTFKKFRKSLKYLSPIMNYIFPRTGAIIDSLSEGPSLEKQKRQLINDLTKISASVVVLIDEIDRLSDDEIMGIAQVVKSIGDLPMFSYLLAYDADRVSSALGKGNSKLGHYYLEKIVQSQNRLPRIKKEAYIDYVNEQIVDLFNNKVIYEINKQLKTEEILNLSKQIMTFIVPKILSTPRDARRLAATLSARISLAGEEVEFGDLLRFCALETRVPTLSDRLQYITARVSVDGSCELSRRGELAESDNEVIKRVLDVYEDEKPLRDLLIYLFPALRPGGAGQIVRNENRLCYEGPLQSLLNFRKVEGTQSRTQARKVLRDPRRLQKHLRQARSSGQLSHAILRLRSVLGQMEAEKEIDIARAEKCWFAVGRFFDKPLSSQEMKSWDYWLELTHVWVLGAMTGHIKSPSKGEDFVQRLIDDDQLHMPAQILFFHFRAHGMFGFRKDYSLSPFLSSRQTRSLAIRAGINFKDRILKSNNGWPLRSIYPIWIVNAASENDEGRAWRAICRYFNEPNSLEHVEGVLVLCLRYQKDNFREKRFQNEIRMKHLFEKVIAMRRSDPEVQSPLHAAHIFAEENLATPLPNRKP